MERSQLVIDRYSRHRRAQQLPHSVNNWPMTRGQLPSHDGLGFSDDQGLEDLFGRIDLNEDNNAFLVGGKNNNLVPWFDNNGVYGGVGIESDMYSTNVNGMENRYNNLLYQNGYSNPPVGSPYATVHGNLDSYQTNFYQAELHRTQMIEYWRRNNAVSSNLPGHIGLSVSPYSSRSEFNSAAISSRQVRKNRVVSDAFNNVPGLSPVMCNNEVNLMDLRGQILGLATDQIGCKMMLMKFEEIKEEEIEMILEEVVDKVSSLMIDQFGNYLVQKLIEVCSEEQRTGIVRSVTKNPYQLIHVCLNLHGTRAVQKLLESLTTEQQISMVISAISPGVVTLIKDGNAYHVIQHCLRHFTDEHNRFLVNEIARNCYEIATDKSGCCVLQLCVDITKGQVRDNLISEIVANALPLSEDRYGNYVVQHLLLMKVAYVTAKVVNELRGHFFSLACNKYGSNVVEKCLTETGEECSKLVIMELLTTPNVSKLLQDPFGNYVFQSALSASQGLLHNALVSLVEKNSASMSSNLYGKKVLAWFDNRNRLWNMYGKARS
ncbi:unnamed protein product [Rhodiola kirilowii]